MSMEPDKPSLRGKNLTEVKKEVKKIADAINGQKAERRSVNEEIAALRAKAETLGISKPALDMAMRYMDWEPEKREGFDIAYMIVREAMGLPMQNDLFGFAEEQEKKAATTEARTEADAVFAGRAPARDEEKIADVTASELKEGEDVFKTKPGEKPAIGEQTEEGVGLDGQAVKAPKGKTERPADDF